MPNQKRKTLPEDRISERQVHANHAHDLATNPIPVLAIDHVGDVLRAIFENTTADLITMETAAREIWGSAETSMVKRAIRSKRVRAYKIDSRTFVSKSDCIREKDLVKNGRPRVKMVVCGNCGRKLTGLTKQNSRRLIESERMRIGGSGGRKWKLDIEAEIEKEERRKQHGSSP